MTNESPIMAGYFRSWRDVANGVATNTAAMTDLPEELDIVFVFPNDEETPLFWGELETEIIPALHAKNIKVVRTVAIEELINPDFPPTAEGYKALANHILDKFYHSAVGLDGLDVDIERTLGSADREKAKAVSVILRERLNKPGELFIYDANVEGDVELLRFLAPHLDYFLFQAYGQNPDRVQGSFDHMFAGCLPPSKFLVGFSFYEERGPMWGDTRAPIENSTAFAYAQWNPTQGKKAGMFSYAIDRDGVAEGDNMLQPTDYSWTVQLKKAMKM